MGPRRILPVAVLLFALAVLVPASHGANGKLALVSIGGDAVAGRTVDFALTITNPADQRQQVGSMNVTPPQGFTLDPAQPRNTLELRNLALAPGDSTTVTVRAAVPCAPVADATWRVVAKQSNDFNGPPGNDIAVAGTLATPVTGACALRFVTQPAAAEVGDVLSGAAYDPAGPPVSVEVVDGAGTRVTSSSAQVTVALAPGSAAGPLGGTTTVAANAGLAEFDDLVIGSPGAYALAASSPGLAGTTSAVFRVDTVGVTCLEDVECTGSAATGRSTLTVTGLPSPDLDATLLRLSYGAGLELDCDGYDELTAGTAVFDVGVREKTATLQIDKRTMTRLPNNGASFLEVCFGAPEPFLTKAGGQAKQAASSYDWDADGDLDPVYRGLLPDCGVAAPPCVSKRNKVGSGDGVIQALLPPGDPAYRG